MSRQSLNMLAQGLGIGAQNFASGFMDNRKRAEQQELIQEFTDPRTSLQRKNQIGVILDPKYATQIAKENQYSSNLSQVMNMVNNPDDSINPVNRAQIPVDQMNMMGGDQFGMQPNIEPNQLPMPQGAPIPGINELMQETATQDPYAEQMQEIERLKKASLAAAAMPGMTTLSNDLNKRADRIAKDVREDQNRKSQIEAAKIKADNQAMLQARKESQSYVDELRGEQKESYKTEALLNEMEYLNDKGDLITPALNKLLNVFGVPLGTLNNPDSEAFDKLSNQLTRGITKYYGTRLNMQEFTNFLRQIPTLQNSHEGQKLIINGLKRSLEPSRLEYQVYRDIMKENGGKRPLDLQDQILDRMEPQLEAWSKDFKRNYNEVFKTPPAQIPAGMVVLITPDEEKIFVPTEKAEEAISRGARRE